MDIAIRIITSLLLDIFISWLISLLYPKFKKKEDEAEKINGAKQVVKTEWKKTLPLMLPCAILVNAVGIVIIAIPNLLEQWLDIDMLIIAVIWWIVMLFDDVILYFMSVTATYDNETITVKKPFLKAKTYRFDEIVKFTASGNLRIVTKNGKITLFNAMSGVKTLREMLILKGVGIVDGEIN